MRRSSKKAHAALPGGLAHYMRTNCIQQSHAQPHKARAVSNAKQQMHPTAASCNSNGSLDCSDENSDPAFSSGGADSSCMHASAAASSQSVPPWKSETQDAREPQLADDQSHESDSDFSLEYAPSQHESRSARYHARMQKLQGDSTGRPTDEAPPRSHPNTASLHSSTEVPLAPARPPARQQAQPSAHPPAFHNRFRAHCHRPSDPRLDTYMHSKFAAAAQSKVRSFCVHNNLHHARPAWSCFQGYRPLQHTAFALYVGLWQNFGQRRSNG